MLARPERTTDSVHVPHPGAREVYVNMLDSVDLNAGAAPVIREYQILHAGGAATPVALFFHTTPR